MNRKVKYLLPLVVMMGLVGCKGKDPSSSHTPSTPSVSTTSVHSSSSSSSSVTGTGSDSIDIPDVGVNLTLDLSGIKPGTGKPDLGENWTTDFTYIYDKSIVLKKTTDYIMTPPFSTKKALTVTITGFLEKGATADDKLVCSIQGIGKDGKVVEEVTVNSQGITGTKETPVDFSVGLKNTNGEVGAIRIGLKTVGRATNFGITKLVVASK